MGLKNFFVKHDAPRLECVCGNRAFDLMMMQAPSKRNGNYALVCGDCGKLDILTKEEYEAAFEFKISDDKSPIRIVKGSDEEHSEP